MFAFPFDPSVYAGLVAAIVGYVWLARRFGATRSQIAWFAVGLITAWAALETPLDTLGDDYLQMAHMVQHMLLIAYVPPLLLLGLSPAMAAFLRRAPLLPALVEPVSAMVLYSLVIVLWHIPYPYDLANDNEFVHIAEHLTFLAAGIIFWWPVIEATSLQTRRQLEYGWRIVYVFIGTIPMLMVALPLQFSRVLFYDSYAHAPEVLPGISHVLDQNISGVLMFVMDMAVMGIDMVVVFYRWFRADEAAQELSSRSGTA